MTETAADLWSKFEAKIVQDGFLHMLKDNSPYKTPTGLWAAEDQIVAALDFSVLLCDSLIKGEVEKREVSKMFPTIGHALNAFERSEYFKTQEDGRRIKADHILLIDYWQRCINSDE